MNRNTLQNQSHTSPIKVSIRSPSSLKFPNNQPTQSFFYPPNHIESETSESVEPFSRIQQEQNYNNSNRQRRKKIFQAKYAQPECKWGQVKNGSFSVENQVFYSINSIEKENSKISIKHSCQGSQPQTFRSVSGNSKNFGDAQTFGSSFEPSIQQNKNFVRKQQKSPTFSKIQEHDFSNLPNQVKKIRQEMLEQKKQISHISEKINRSQQENLKKQKQLLQSLIKKQTSLTEKQQQINNHLEKMSRIQNESGQRYQKILKCQLQLQRSKRLDDLSRENERLYQQLMKNTSKDTIDMTPFSHAVNLQGNFRDQNSHSISQLNYQFEDYNQEANNTIQQLLSPLQIKPDFQL